MAVNIRNLLVIVCILFLTNADALRVVCFYSNWAQHRPGKGTYLPATINLKLCTHFIYAYADLHDLELQPTEDNDQSTKTFEGMYEQVINTKERNPRIKILLSVGGKKMGSEPFLEVVQSDRSMSDFAKNAISYLRTWQFNGLDMAWEYPSAKEKPQFQRLMETLMRAFENEGSETGNDRLLLTVSMPALKNDIDKGYNVNNLARTVDFISIMSVNMHGDSDTVLGFNSPLYAHPDETGAAAQRNLDWIAHYYLSLGAPEDLLNIGIATCGRSFTLKSNDRHSILSAAIGDGKQGSYTAEPGILAYYEVCEMFKGAKRVWVDSQKSPYYVKGNQWVGFDDVDSVTAKACYVRETGYGGVLIWTSDYDDFQGMSCDQGEDPLLNAAHKVMKYSKACDWKVYGPSKTTISTTKTTKKKKSSTTERPPPEPISTEPDAFRTVCYFTNWAQARKGKGQFLPEHIDPEFCTHIIYAFAKPDGVELQPIEDNDDSTNTTEGMYAQVVKLKETKPNLKILLSVGGSYLGAEPFEPIVESTDSMTTFAKNAIQFLRKRKFDGLDVDWEYPSDVLKTDKDKPKFGTLMEILMKEFINEGKETNTPRLMLTLAAAPEKENIDGSYFVDKLVKTVDFMTLMTFDFHGAWEDIVGFNSPLYAHPNETGAAAELSMVLPGVTVTGVTIITSSEVEPGIWNSRNWEVATDWVAKYYVSLGAPPELLIIGIATYGRSFTLKNREIHDVLSPSLGKGRAGPITRQEGIMSYYEVCESQAESGNTVRVPSQKNPYYVKDNQWVGFDDVESVKAKATYVADNKFGGVAIWPLDFDDFHGTSCNQGKFPLLRAASTIMKNASEAKRQEDAKKQKRKDRYGKLQSVAGSLVGNNGYLYFLDLLFILFNIY